MLIATGIAYLDFDENIRVVTQSLRSEVTRNAVLSHARFPGLRESKRQSRLALLLLQRPVVGRVAGVTV